MLPKCVRKSQVDVMQVIVHMWFCPKTSRFPLK